jgi:hypothetical protein
MKIGIMADSHDNIPNIEKAIDIFNDSRISLMIHAGDFIAPFSINSINRLKSSYIGVFGNNDGEKEGLRVVSNHRIKEPPYIIEINNKRIFITHIFKNNAKDCDIIIFGHTHKPELKKEEGSIIINPGECGGWLTGRATISILDMDNMKVDFIDL